MLGNITIGQYFPGNSVLHRLDPRAKILLTIGLVVAVFLAGSVPGYALLFAFVGAAAWLSHIDIKFLVKGLKAIYVIIIITFVINLLFTRSGEELFRLGAVVITEGGLANALSMACRLLLLVMGTQLLTLTTSPIDLTDGIERLLQPLRRIGFPAHELAMMMSIALRFIPTLIEETDKIMSAQKARGADFESGNLLQRARAMIPLLVPLFISAFRRADELAVAMECRCYQGGKGRTRMKQLHYAGRDYAALSLGLALLAAVILLRSLGI